MSYRAKFGDRVQIKYVSQLSDDTSTAVSQERRVLEFEVGSEQVIVGINRGVVGMAEGDRKRLTLVPQEAYGAIRKDLIREIPRQRIPSTVNLVVGKWLIKRRKKPARSRRVRIIDINPATVLVDGNHPLAGKTVKVEMELLSVHAAILTRTYSQTTCRKDELRRKAERFMALNNRKPQPLNVSPVRRRCSICGDPSYSLSGVHPQCAARKAGQLVPPDGEDSSRSGVKIGEHSLGTAQMGPVAGEMRTWPRPYHATCTRRRDRRSSINTRRC